MDPDLDFGEELNYKIRAYNCTAIGNENSYSIEQFVPDALPGMDMIVRMRKRLHEPGRISLGKVLCRRHLV